MTCKICDRELTTDWEEVHGVCEKCYQHNTDKTAAQDKPIIHECRVCGRDLVNDWQIEHGICAVCHKKKANEVAAKPRDGIAKYIRALSMFRVINIIFAVLSVIGGMAIASSYALLTNISMIAGIVSAIFFAGMAVIFGALREILQQL